MIGKVEIRLVSFLSVIFLASASKPSWLTGGNEEYEPNLRRTLVSNTRRLQSIAEDTCQEDVEAYEDLLEDVGGECTCEDTTDGVVLICMDACTYCNEDEDVCGIQSAQVLYDIVSGDPVALGGVFRYVVGYEDTLAVENLECSSTDGVITSCETCNVYVNGKICNSCELKDCGDGTFAENMDCENIEYGATFDFCESVTIEDDSVFTAFSSEGYDECLPLDQLDSKKSKKSKRSKSGKKGGGKETSLSITTAKSSKGGGKSAKKAKSRRGRGLLSFDEILQRKQD